MSDSPPPGNASGAPTPPPPGPRTTGVGFGPIALISLGLLLLASNVGWFTFGDLFRILSFWPVALVAIGVDMLTAGRYRLAIVAASLVTVAVLWAADGARSSWNPFAGGADGDRVSVTTDLVGADRGRLVLDVAVGRVRVTGGAPPGRFVTGSIVTGRGETIEQRGGRQGDTVVLELRSQQQRGGVGIGPEERSWSLAVTNEVPVAIEVTAGVGQTTLDLSRVRLEALSYAGGVGESTITLPEGAYAANLDLGVGSTTIVIPRGAPVRVVADAGLGRVSVAGDLRREGNVYASADFDPARDHIALRVRGGVGAIDIQRR
jgi:hypothetical protein